jgi:hypothetical protein
VQGRCSSSSSSSDAIRMRVLAVFAAHRSLQDFLLNKTLLRLVFAYPPTPIVLPRLRPGSLSPVDALDPLYESTASDTPSVSLGHHGVHSQLQKRHQVRSARVRRHTVFENLVTLAEYSTDILVQTPRQTVSQCSFFRSHLLVICTATPRYTAATAREHQRVLAQRLITPCASVTSPLHTP